MAEPRTLARPYAEAAFALGREDNTLPAWSNALDTLAGIVAHPDVVAVIGNPRVAQAKVVDAILDLAGDRLDSHAANLVRVLADNRRLNLLPAIAAQYAELRADAENRVQVEVTTAHELAATQQERLADSLSRRLHRVVSLTCRSDPDLLGGAVIRAGDLIIDGSVRASLAQLGQRLTA